MEGLTIEERVKGFEKLEITQTDFDKMLEYNWSLPSGTTIGKRWKKNLYFRRSDEDLHVIGEYVPCDIKDQVGIKYYCPVIIP